MRVRRIRSLERPQASLEMLNVWRVFSPREVHRVVAVFLAFTTTGSCTRTDEPSASMQLSDSADVTVVENHEPLWAGGEAWSVSIEPRLIIGVTQGRSEYQLFDVSAAARQSDGDIVVIDGREVRLYGGNGTFVRTLGGPGSGPGEFQDPAQVLVTTADSVIVWDNAHYRLTRFDAAGERVSVESVDRGGIGKAIEPPLYPGTAELLADDEIVVRLVEKAKDYPAGVFRPRSGALRVSTNLARIDTLMFFGDFEQVSVRAPWGEWPAVPALAKGTSIAVQPTQSKACVGDQAVPEVVCFGPGPSRTLIRWTTKITPVSNREIAAWRDTTIGLYAQKMSEPDARRVLDQVPVPTDRPHYSRIVLDRSGNLWVSVGPAARMGAEYVGHLVFDQSGALLGRVDLPPVEVLEIGDDYVMGVYRDALEVEYLHVYDLVKQSADDSES